MLKDFANRYMFNIMPQRYKTEQLTRHCYQELAKEDIDRFFKRHLMDDYTVKNFFDIVDEYYGPSFSSKDEAVRFPAINQALVALVEYGQQHREKMMGGSTFTKRVLVSVKESN